MSRDGRIGVDRFDSAEDFAEWYAYQSHTTVDTLAWWGRFPESCDCGEPDCTGWAMGYQHEDALADDVQRTRVLTGM